MRRGVAAQHLVGKFPRVAGRLFVRSVHGQHVFVPAAADGPAAVIYPRRCEIVLRRGVGLLVERTLK